MHNYKAILTQLVWFQKPEESIYFISVILPPPVTFILSDSSPTRRHGHSPWCHFSPDFPLSLGESMHCHDFDLRILISLPLILTLFREVPVICCYVTETALSKPISQSHPQTCSFLVPSFLLPSKLS